MSSVIPPPEWKGRFVPFLDVLLFMRARLLEGTSPRIFLGRVDAHALRSFVNGVGFYVSCCGADIDEFMEFKEWLRDKGEFSDPEGWEGRYLADCHGDHQKAIMKFLDRCAEFVALRRASGNRS